jgi:predicted DNA-binding protein YlxM (UPF0122 family)
MAKSKLTADVRSKIEEIASLDGTVEEMAYYCNVSRQTIYNYLDPESDFFDKSLAENVERLRANPILKARRTIVNSLEQPAQAQWYLTRKKKKEFGDNIDVTTDGKEINYTDEQIATIFQRRSASSDTSGKE